MENKGISAAMSAEATATVIASINTVNELLPFLVPLSPKERIGRVKLGPKSIHFVQSARTVANQNADLVKAIIDLDEFNRDVALVEGIESFVHKLTHLHEAVDDTRTAVGGEAMMAAMRIYGVLKAARHTIPGLDQSLAEMGARFRYRSAPKSTDETADAAKAGVA